MTQARSILLSQTNELEGEENDSKEHEVKKTGRPKPTSCGWKIQPTADWSERTTETISGRMRSCCKARPRGLRRQECKLGWDRDDSGYRHKDSQYQISHLGRTGLRFAGQRWRSTEVVWDWSKDPLPKLPWGTTGGASQGNDDPDNT